MNLCNSLTKGHLPNKDRIVWQKGCPYWRGSEGGLYMLTRILSEITLSGNQNTLREKQFLATLTGF